MDRINDIPLFANLSDENIKKLEKISTFKKYDGGEILFYEGDDPGILYILVDGVLRLYKTDPKGNEIYIHQFVPTGMVGELACFENMKYPATARFVTKGQVLKIDFKRLEKDFFADPKVSMEIIKSLTKKIKILSNVIHKEMILTSEAKVARLIIIHGNMFETMKNTQIASMANMTPETLSRILSKFKKAGYIKIDENHHIEVLEELILKAMFE